MRLSVITEQRFQRTPDGAVWTATANATIFFLSAISVGF